LSDFPTDPTTWDVDAHRRRLAETLPEMRALPSAPLGTDADILAMSLPPYYTACPNPNLADWLAATTPEGHDDGKYVDPGPFTTDISEGKSNPFYKAHSYPTKVPHPAIMRFLLHYTEPGDVVLDGFCGTGMTGVAAQTCGMPPNGIRGRINQEMRDVRWGTRRAVLADLAPAATFIAAGLNLPFDAKAFDRRSAEILDQFEAEWGWMYETTDGRGRARKIDYTVWSEVFTCPACASPVVFYDVALDEATGAVRDVLVCPACGNATAKDGLQRRMVGVQSLAGDDYERIDLRPVEVHYRDSNMKKSKQLDDQDWATLRRVAAAALPRRVPTDELPLPQMVHGSRLGPKGFTRLHHLWSDRALIALSSLWEQCDSESDPLLRHALVFWIEQAAWGLSWMNRFVPRHYSHVNQFLSGVYYVPSQHAEYHPRISLEGTTTRRGKRAAIVKMWEVSPARLGHVAVSTGSSTQLGLPDASIDYVFVDPPFGANIPYSDLAIPVECWHGVRTNPLEEAVTGRAARFLRTLTEYGELMERCFSEFHRVLKPGRWMTVEFSNSSNEVWLTIQHALAKAGSDLLK
jgi:hypothetical protein